MKQYTGTNKIHFHFLTMSTHGTETEALPVAAPKKAKKLKPARKQVKAGDVVKTETPQTGKEYSTSVVVQF
jgi:hypothetical protein